MKKEYVIWGITASGLKEELLLANFKGQPITSIEQAEKLVDILTKNYQCTEVRIQMIDFNEPFDFIKTINK